ncbi:MULTISPECIES: beta-ketoacyl synthase N-terminal-like domain-containing protein [unclassified Burkholderia]|uniref:type I polyketide synthase n=1 Tax=unclassified Burkholderia TaxID=2613784 RepID=UPI00162A9A81|nr:MULTISPECIES: beta-ketoacyl synthase N-terminal-like domain-containing protein [unclassified Burkholderia]
MNTPTLERWLSEAVATRAGCPVDAIELDRPIFDFGIDSVAVVRIADALSTLLQRPFDPADFFEFPTISALAAHLCNDALSVPTERCESSARPVPREAAALRESFAIVGIACRMPGARDKDAFWEALCAGRDCISGRPSNRPRLAGAANAYATASEQAGYLDDIDQFDAAFFRISPKEAQHMDPQQRLLLQVAWEALEDAGMRAGDIRQTDGGVFVGISHSDYSQGIFSGACPVDSYSSSANALSVAANRLSFYLDLVGPSLAIDTACSSSLTAAHLAIASLRAGECGFALVGGVNLMLSPEVTDALSLAGILSPDRRCKPFSALADGYVRGEGCAVVVVKRLERALADNDRIYAVIAGSAVRQNGRSNSLTAPNPGAQESMLRAAAVQAGVTPAGIDYVEAHGTGTSLGDHVEMTALGRAFGAGRDAGAPLLIGAVKSNIGHLEAAAGIAGLVKVALALHHGEIPGTLHASPQNRAFDFAGSAIEVVHAHRPWPCREHRRTAGVSSFGFGGANAHLILQDAPRRIPRARVEIGSSLPRLFALSARTPDALKRQARVVAQWLKAQCGGTCPDLDDLAYTSIARREPLPYRRAFVANSLGALAAELESFATTAGPPACSRAGHVRAVFRFGVPSHGWLVMVRDACRADPLFVSVLRRCDEILETLGIAWRVADGIAPEAAESGVAALAVQLGIVHVLKAGGVMPSVLQGTGSGRFAAAVAAGALPLHAAVRALLGGASSPVRPDAEFHVTDEADDAGARYVSFDCGGELAPASAGTGALPAEAAWGGGRHPLHDALANWFGAGGALRYRASVAGFVPSLVSLPPYAWEPTRYWIEAAPRRPARREPAEAASRSLGGVTAAGLRPGAEVYPETELEASLLSIWKGIVALPSAGVTDTLLNVGKPADIALFRNRIAERLGHIVRLDTLTRFPTIRDLARAMQAASDDREALSASARRGAARRHALG